MIQAPDMAGLGPLPFGEYAAVYDLIYQDKDYAAEADFIVGLISRFAGGEAAPTAVIDLACGTGRHALELARRGFTVAGSDISGDMVEMAKRSAAQHRLPVQFYHHSFQTAGVIDRKFDVALAMFASLGYLTTWEEFAAACSGVRRLLASRGLFIFDVWNGDAVVRDFSPQRTKRASGAGLSVERTSRTTLDQARQVADVHFDFAVTRQNGSVSRFSERHLVRFFFPSELSERLSALGFTVLLRCPFMAPESELTGKDWNMTFVARCQPA